MNGKKFYCLTINYWWDWEVIENEKHYFQSRDGAIARVKELEPKEREKDIADSFVIGDRYSGKKARKHGENWTEYLIEEQKFED